MKKVYLIFALYTLLFSSCAERRNLVYFSDLAKVNGSEKVEDQSIKIEQNDLLRINVNSLNQESNLLFASVQNPTTRNNEEPTGYRVSKNGEVNIPVIGNIKVEGLTIAEAQDILASKLDKYVKKPVVEVQIQNFKITVIGEVNRPSNFTVPGDHINLLEALGMAGDMTAYGKRENVLIIRQQNGQRIMKRLNLNEQDVLNSPFFTLKQNDVVYVEPDKSKAIEYSPNTRIMPIVIASISAVAVLISVFLRR
ncbi:polysaccharide biosynthesis/export family protein [Pedobacter sp. B4-66]|uniref:polysaccharide biosynthesis/export family protein n=1 Tax=Pedobacter sp. B4-66 TaxID=2817280 RepID=UPI001BDA110C|nr:polysaccharide biosynthesis/export family protein [Pedobacter sp. B4-66]